MLLINHSMKTVYDFKHRLQDLWSEHRNDHEKLKEALHEWCHQAEVSGLEVLQKFAIRMQAIVCEIHYPCKSMSNETIISLFIKGKKSNPENAEKAVKRLTVPDEIVAGTDLAEHKNCFSNRDCRLLVTG